MFVSIMSCSMGKILKFQELLQAKYEHNVDIPTSNQDLSIIVILFVAKHALM